MAGVPLTLLSWIKTEVDRALKVVRDSIARYVAAPEDATVLSGCPGQLHQVSGALRIVGLEGATRFCETIEGVFGKLNGARPRRSAIEVIDRAVLELGDFIDDLARGQANVPVRLYSAYHDLSTLQGKWDTSEKDLFYPDLDLQAPPHPDTKVIAKEALPPYFQAQRARFQRGLLASLRKQTSGLKEMRQALDALHQVAPQLPEPRALWWAAAGLIDGMNKAADADWLGSARGLCNKIDFQMRDLASGSKNQNEALLREVLYAIAKCRTSTSRIKDIRQLYQLDVLVPEVDVAGLIKYDMDWLQPALTDARSRLEVLKNTWQQFVSGEPKNLARFRESVGSFRAKAAELGSQQLVKLLDVIVLVSTRLPDPYPRQNQFMVVEMASAFLLVESIIDSFTTPPADLEQQIVIMGGWLLDAAKGKSSGEPPPGLRVDLSRRIGALQLRAQVIREIFANLRHIEQVLDAFARDRDKRGTLPGLKPHLRQIHGALAVLRFERAAEVLTVCDRLITDCAGADHGETSRGLDWIAEGLSTLGFYLEPCLHGAEPTEQPIKLFFSRFEKRDIPAAHALTEVKTVVTIPPVASMRAAETASVPPDLGSAPVEPAAETAAAQQPPVNEDMLAIYLDEAGDVLGTIDAALPRCREQHHDRDALTTIRRGFHTLKGSGRMVGLMELGEVAWQVEQVLNQYLEQERPATPRLLELIGLASASFAAWVAQIRSSKSAAIDAQPITRLAQRLISSLDTAATVVEAPVTQAAAPVAAPRLIAATPDVPAAEPAEVTIGDTRLARSFYQVYVREAAQHVSTLEAEYNEWCNSTVAEASHELLRAAHTLASSSRTAGFTAIADLAGEVEQWTPFAQLISGVRDVEVVREAIEKLREMVDAVARGEPPTPDEELMLRLRETTARLRAESTRIPTPEPIPAEAVPAVPESPAAPAPGSAPAPVTEGKNLRKMRDDLDAQLVPIFLEEARELLPLIGADLREWKASPDNQRIPQSLMRTLHTLKGSARMSGAIRLGELTHLMESRIEATTNLGAPPPELFEELESKMDRLSLDLERMREEQDASVNRATAGTAPSGDEAAHEAAPRGEPPLPSPAALLRINADTLDHLINASGEVGIARSRIEAELRVVKQSLSDLNESITRLRGQLREIEIQADSQLRSRAAMLDERSRDFDPLEFDRYTRLQELTRLMGESLHDATTIHQALLKNLGETDSALLQQARTSRDVQQELMRMRAVPFASLNERLYRVVRQVARELGKKAELEIEDSQLEIDRGVLERVGAPLEHMLRNALVHGLEPPAARSGAGKPETGRITVTLRQESNEMAVIVSDDGGGLDLEALHRKALEKGVLRHDQAVSEADLVQLIFSGLSTAGELTELSGRGVGMDVVRNEIYSLGGRIDVATVRGKGTTFTIYLPLTLAVTQAVLVRGGGSVHAISSAMVEQVLRFKADAMAGIYARKVVESQDRTYPLHYLQHLLGVPAATDVQNYNSVLLLRSGAQRIALHVDEMLGNQEIVVKRIGPQLARAPGVVGATVLADGRIALIVNPVLLAQRSTRAAPLSAAAPARPAAPLIMVVDDSLTVRKVTSRLLEREGYRVLTAKDGMDALEQMKDTLPDVMLVDIEMPRMDGFDLTKAVRRDPRTRAIPIIIISSRTAEKHRSHAAQLGVNAFLGKPFQESDLLGHVSRYLAGEKRAGAKTAVAATA